MREPGSGFDVAETIGPSDEIFVYFRNNFGV